MTLREPNSIDIVTEHADLGYVKLIMLEVDGWGDIDLATQQLQEKVNMYLSYALDGQLGADYPHLVNKRVNIQLDCLSPPPPEITQITDRIAISCKQYGVEFSVNVLV